MRFLITCQFVCCAIVCVCYSMCNVIWWRWNEKRFFSVDVCYSSYWLLFSVVSTDGDDDGDDDVVGWLVILLCWYYLLIIMTPTILMRRTCVKTNFCIIFVCVNKNLFHFVCWKSGPKLWVSKECILIFWLMMIAVAEFCFLKQIKQIKAVKNLLSLKKYVRGDKYFIYFLLLKFLMGGSRRFNGNCFQLSY